MAVAIGIAITAASAIAVIVNLAVETPAAIIAAKVTAKEETMVVPAVVERAEAAGVKTAAMKTFDEATFGARGSGEQNHH